MRLEPLLFLEEFEDLSLYSVLSSEGNKLLLDTLEGLSRFYSLLMGLLEDWALISKLESCLLCFKLILDKLVFESLFFLSEDSVFNLGVELS